MGLINIKKLISNFAEARGYYFGILPPAQDTLPRHLAALFELLGVNCVLDVGAHQGEFGRMLRAIGYRRKIVSWEPVSSSFEVLSTVASEYSDWVVHNYALGSEQKQLPINVAIGTQGSSFLPVSRYGEEQFHNKLTARKTENVEVRTLAEVLDGCVAGISEPRIFLKIDAQGYDLEVVKGASHRLDEIAALQIELAVKPIYEGMTTYVDMISKLNEIGFELSGLFPVRIDHYMRLIEMDGVMVRRPIVG